MSVTINNVPPQLDSCKLYEVTRQITHKGPFQANITGTIGLDVAPRGGHMALKGNVLTFTVTVSLTEAFDLVKVFTRNADLSAEFTLVEVQLK